MPLAEPQHKSDGHKHQNPVARLHLTVVVAEVVENLITRFAVTDGGGIGL